jgi:hypothetical protein
MVVSPFCLLVPMVVGPLWIKLLSRLFLVVCLALFIVSFLFLDCLPDRHTEEAIFAADVLKALFDESGNR